MRLQHSRKKVVVLLVAVLLVLLVVAVAVAVMLVVVLRLRGSGFCGTLKAAVKVNGKIKTRSLINFFLRSIKCIKCAITCCMCHVAQQWQMAVPTAPCVHALRICIRSIQHSTHGPLGLRSEFRTGLLALSSCNL